MNLRTGIVTTVVAGLLLGPAAAQEQYALQMKYSPGEKYVSNIAFSGIGTISLDYPGGPGQPGDLWINGQLDLSEETKSVDDRGVADVEWKLGALDAEYQFLGMSLKVILEDGQVQVLMGDRVVFDSRDPEQAKANPMLGLIGESFVVKLDKTGKIVGVPQFEVLLKMMMPSSDLKTALEQNTGPLPPGPVKIGDTWEQRDVWPYGVPEGMERPVFVTRHTFEALEPVGGHQCAKIAAAGAVDVKDAGMELPTFIAPMLGGGRLVSITMDAMAVDWVGTHYFDIERGTTLKMDATITLSFDMTQKLQIPKQQGQQGGEQEGGVAGEAPEAREMQEIDIGIKIDDLVIDLAVEVAQ